MTFPIQVILVPQGAEYRAICRGLSRIIPTPLVVPIPIGPEPLTRHLNKLQQVGHFSNYQQLRVLLMGLCGSLTHRYSVGDIVIYQACAYTNAAPGRLHLCAPPVTTLLQEKLNQASLVKALTSDHLVWSADEKRRLGQIYGADVVDMEGFAALEVLSPGVAVAILRVVSDDCQHDLPNLTSALSSDGSLQTLPLAIGMIRQPIAATRLIQGALRGLQVLQEVTTLLFTE